MNFDYGMMVLITKMTLNSPFGMWFPNVYI